MATPAAGARAPVSQTTPTPPPTPITNQLRTQLDGRLTDPVVGGLINVLQSMEQDRANLNQQIVSLNARVGQLRHSCETCCLTRLLCSMGCCTSPVPVSLAVTHEVTNQQPINQ